MAFKESGGLLGIYMGILCKLFEAFSIKQNFKINFLSIISLYVSFNKFLVRIYRLKAISSVFYYFL